MKLQTGIGFYKHSKLSMLHTHHRSAHRLIPHLWCSSALVGFADPAKAHVNWPMLLFVLLSPVGRHLNNIHSSKGIHLHLTGHSERREYVTKEIAGTALVIFSHLVRRSQLKYNSILPVEARSIDLIMIPGANCCSFQLSIISISVSLKSSRLS